ncbi:MAG TPA: type II toxin-antitoxin system HicA family toxin [Candidatus Acidoferrales bacterium]|nr:type II toxin-antitoxin system HicA family toxin [Candidatus Acidoferrales bacterium]
MKLPLISAKDALRALAKKGYAIDHQTGSHIIVRQSIAPYRRLTVPNHNEIAKGTLRAILRQAAITIEEFLELL